MAPSLPQEIITSILKRLPVKSLIRFQCVCKHWENLLKTSSFITDHLHHSSNHNPSIIFRWIGQDDTLHIYFLDGKMQVLEVQKPPMMDYVTRAAIVCTSNGLLCVKINKPTRNRGMSPPHLLLWNPATREMRQVPKNINDFGDEFFIGFGFSPIVNDYKIVMPSFSKHGVHRVEVFSLTSGSWKEVECGTLVGLENLSRKTVTANGVMFWLGSSKDSIIVSFDMAVEVFALIPMPVLDHNSYATLTAHKDRLAVLSVIGEFESKYIDLWVMEEAIGSSSERWSWTKIYTSSRFSYCCYIPVTIWGNEIFCTNACEVPNAGLQIDLFNLTTDRFRMRFINTCDLSNGVFNYAESLVPVGGMKFAVFM